MTVINFFGAPGSGKSTAAAGLLHLMKCRNLNVEIATEVAKPLVYGGLQAALADQLHIFAQQHHKLHMLDGQVDFVITDSPLLLSIVYKPDDYPPSFVELVHAMFARYRNVNFFIRPVFPYQQAGRVQTEAQANFIGLRLRQLLAERRIPYLELDGDARAPQSVLHWLDGAGFPLA